ncbi:MAG: N-acetyl-gamma-glutamyl-phosphate reductase [Nitrospinaceae bacterium]|mgnify:FL=1|jgi:N-acetyl-gamma-glutamyl-phosphate reductase|nr:N-acetyl-gamma-glutamyl-phosphate reductase [Nitrospinaceae bacterium]
MIKIGIAGASGYTGLELIRLLVGHPGVELTVLTSETFQGQNIAEVFPSLNGIVDLELRPLDNNIAKDCQVLFLALPHTMAMSKLPDYLQSDCKIIDLSADYRLKDPKAYTDWYSVTHTNPELLEKAVYGLPELHRQAIQSAQLVANPGCYPTSVVLALAPLLKTDWVDLGSIISDSKSGVSGAGRKPSLTSHFAEVNEGISPYGLADHRHTPEMEQELSALAGKSVRLTFSPHLVPMTRGMLSTVYINLNQAITDEKLVEHYRSFYKGENFIRVLNPGKFASSHHVLSSNFCDIGLKVDSRNQRLIITSALDNLIKGASGQAVQNMNIMLGLDEKTGLMAPAIFP